MPGSPDDDLHQARDASLQVAKPEHTIETDAPERRFWVTLAAFGVPPEEWDDGAYIADPGGVRPSISFLKVPEPKVVTNRLHLDVNAGGGCDEPWEVRWPRGY